MKLGFNVDWEYPDGRLLEHFRIIVYQEAKELVNVNLRREQYRMANRILRQTRITLDL